MFRWRRIAAAIAIVLLVSVLVIAAVWWNQLKADSDFVSEVGVVELDPLERLSSSTILAGKGLNRLVTWRVSSSTAEKLQTRCLRTLKWYPINEQRPEVTGRARRGASGPLAGRTVNACVLFEGTYDSASCRVVAFADRVQLACYYD